MMTKNWHSGKFGNIRLHLNNSQINILILWYWSKLWRLGDICRLRNLLEPTNTWWRDTPTWISTFLSKVTWHRNCCYSTTKQLTEVNIRIQRPPLLHLVKQWRLGSEFGIKITNFKNGKIKCKKYYKDDFINICVTSTSPTNTNPVSSHPSCNTNSFDWSWLAEL